jgi:hypothetical protein
MTAQNLGERATTSPAPRHARTGRASGPARLMSVVFAIAMIAAVVVGLWVSVSGPDEAASNRLARLRLVETVTGPEAVAEISRLHGAGTGVTGGYVAHYQGSAGRAVLYVGRTDSDQDAAVLMKQLEDRIVEESDRYSDLEPRMVGGVRVLSVLSGGEPHYFWQARSLVIWLGFERDYPAGLIAAVNALH